MAHRNRSVKVVEVCNVAPQPSSPHVSATQPPPAPPPESLPLTLFDLPWLRFAPVERLFFYEIPIPASFDTTTFFTRLKTSLSITLQQFLPLAGNIIWPQHSPKPILTYLQGDGVSLTIAEYSNNADNFHHLSSIHDFVEAEDYHPLVPQLSISHEKAAAMAIQVTIFPNRGFSIGISMHHAIMDGKTSTLFIKSWAQISKHGDQLPDQLKPFFDRKLIQNVAGLESVFLNQLLNIEGPYNRSLATTQFTALPPDPIRGTFLITRTKIESLKQLVKEQTQLQVPISTFSLTSAYTWVCLVKTEQMQKGTAVMGFAGDCRSRLDPPVPETYFGNCVTPRVIVAERKELLGEDGLLVAVNMISEAVKSFQSAGIFNGAEEWIPILYPSVRRNERFLGVAGSPRFQVYETDFGWGRPKKVEVVSIERTGAMSLAESKDAGGGGGVEVGLVLSRHQMQVFADLFAQELANL